MTGLTNVSFIKAKAVGRYLDAANRFQTAMLNEGVLSSCREFWSSDAGVFVEVNDVIVGMAIYNKFGSRTEATVCLVYVDPAFRGRGFATSILKVVETELSNAGIRRVYIDASTEAMQSVASRLGYAEPTQCMTKNIELRG